jgi:diguanylate cyclase (GGDEF)-like protein
VSKGVFPAVLLLLGHGLSICLFPEQARTLSILCITGVTLWAAVACALRSQAGGASRTGWLAVAFAVLLWGAGMAANLEPAATGGAVPNPGLSMLLFILYMVPLAFALGYSSDDPMRVRIVDGGLALVLASLFFIVIFQYASLLSTPEQNIPSLREMFDIGNIFILGFSIVRWLSSTASRQRALFGCLSVYAAIYMAVAYYVNHIEPEDADYGMLVDLVLDVPFLVLALAASRPEPRAADPGPRTATDRIVQVASPLILPIALLLVSANMLQSHPVLAAVGFAAATLGYGLRTVLGQLHSVTRLERLNVLAKVDGLTSVANRRHFDEMLHLLWERARRAGEGIALLMVDVDHFKAINDKLGHQAGDECLRVVARTLERCTSPATDFVARYGGEEFCVLMFPVGEGAAVRVAESIRKAIAASVLRTPATRFRVTVSVGAAVVERVTGESPDVLITLADAALYEGKHAGRNRVALRRLAVDSDWSGTSIAASEQGAK